MIKATGFNRDLALFAAYATIVHESDTAIAAHITGATATASATISATGHAFTVGQRIIREDTGTGWTEIPAAFPLYVVAASAGVSFGVALTEGGAAISTTGTAGAFHACEVFYAEPLTDDSSVPEMAQVKRRGDNGVSGLVSEDMKETASAWGFGLDEALRTLDIFNGVDVGTSLGYDTIYVRDAKDITSKVRKKSERFRGSLASAGNITYGDGDYTRPKLKLSAVKPDGSQVTWTRNATVS